MEEFLLWLGLNINHIVFNTNAYVHLSIMGKLVDFLEIFIAFILTNKLLNTTPISIMLLNYNFKWNVF